MLNLVPRHQEIVAEITRSDSARVLTSLIGIAEVIMSIWILSKYKSRLNALIQIAIVATMNIIEFFAVPQLLLWGKFNSVFALIFILAVYYTEFILKEKVESVKS